MLNRVSILTLCLLLFSTSVISSELTVDQLAIDGTTDYQRSFASGAESQKDVPWLKSRRFWAWTTMAFLGATALTGREMKVNPTHKAVSMFAMMSYGAYAYSDMVSDESGPGNKWSNAARWLHIPAMLLLPVAGTIAERQFSKGEHSATGIGATHKPAALAAVLGMALSTLSLTWDFYVSRSCEK